MSHTDRPLLYSSSTHWTRTKGDAFVKSACVGTTTQPRRAGPATPSSLAAAAGVSARRINRRITSKSHQPTHKLPTSPSASAGRGALESSPWGSCRCRRPSAARREESKGTAGAHLEERIGVVEPLAAALDLVAQLPDVRLVQQRRLRLHQHGEGYAEKDLRPLRKQGVPHPEHSLRTSTPPPSPPPLTGGSL
jgi:hypothetical protein